MGQGSHLPGRPQDTWPDGSWDVTVTWLGSGARTLLLSSGIFRNTTREEVQISISPDAVLPRVCPPTYFFFLSLCVCGRASFPL